MMVRQLRRSFRHFLFLVLLLFLIGGHYRIAAKSLPSSGTQRPFRLYSPESEWVLADLDGDHTPDFAVGQRLGRTKDGYFYQIQLELTGDASSTSLTVVHNDALGIKITGVDIDGDNDIDLIISDRFFHQHIVVWLNDGKGRFVKSPPGRFSPNTGSDLALSAVDLNWLRQPTLTKRQQPLPNYLPAGGYTQPLLSLALNQRRVEWLFHVATDPLHPRAPPTVVTA